ncbi:MAG TPA: hypothetical protein PL033_08285 [Candidatus Brocadiia bacterium]|nr:hypothetical protein [Candidatus Brocadiia bacterium]
MSLQDTPERPAAPGGLKLISVCIIASLAYNAALLSRVWPSISGDSAIHLVYARNLARGLMFEFNPGEKSFGSTSPAWMALQAICFRFFPDSAITLCAAQAMFFHMACPVLAAWLVWKIARSSLAAGWAAIAWTLCSGYSGITCAAGCMETPFCAFLIFCASLLLFHCVRDPEPRPILFAAMGIALGMLPLVRPECVIYSLCYGAAIAAANWKRGGGRNRGWTLAAFALAAAVFLPYELYQARHTGSLIPDSGLSRLLFAREGAPRIAGVCISERLVFRFASDAAPALLIVFGSLAVFQKPRDLFLGALAASFAGNIVFWTFAFPMRLDWYTGRYWQVVWPPLVILGACGTASCEFLQTFVRKDCANVITGRKIRMMSPVIILAAVTACREAVNVLTYKPSHIHNACDLKLCRTLEAITPPHSTILTLEVQARYFLDRRILSMDGITDGKILPFMKPGADHADFLLKYRPDFMIFSSMLDRRLQSYGESLLLLAPRAFTRLAAMPQPAGTRITIDASNTRLIGLYGDGEIIITKPGSGVNFHFNTDRGSLFWYFTDIPTIRLTYDK